MIHKEGGVSSCQIVEVDQLLLLNTLKYIRTQDDTKQIEYIEYVIFLCMYKHRNYNYFYFELIPFS